MAVEVGQVLDGKYRIIRLIGKGGMGAVYEAEHLLIDRRVAVKELHAEALAAENAIKRFEREARAAGRIGSDHILQIFDVGGLPDGSRYMVSELLDGETLATRLQRVGRISPQQVLPIIQQLLVGLAAAHSAGVLHRDLKPDNVFLVRSKAGIQDFVKIIDFGIAKFQQLSQDDGFKMTRTGAVVGTPYYLPPEQARGTGEVDTRSDLYSLGVILYECVTGEVPFNALNFNELLFKIVLETPVPPSARAPDVDPRFSELVLKAMAREPAERFQSAEQLQAALYEWAEQYAVNVRQSAPSLGSTGPRASAPSLSSTGPRAGQSGTSMLPRTAAVAGVRTLSVPTPSAFGSTQVPILSDSTTFQPPARWPKVVGVSASLLLLAGVALGAVRFFGHPAPSSTASASAGSPQIASPVVSVAPNATVKPEASAIVSAVGPPLEAPASIAITEAPSSAARKTRPAGRVPAVPRAPTLPPVVAPVAAPVAQPVAPVVAPVVPPAPQPAARPAPAKHRNEWGY